MKRKISPQTAKMLVLASLLAGDKRIKRVCESNVIPKTFKARRAARMLAKQMKDEPA